jgi:uncharacterized membrane protein (GlpM family)
VDTLALKLILTPALIGSASLAGRRWGEGFSGWLVGLPFTSGPVIFFLALDHGAGFAAATAAGALAGASAEAAFALAYGALCLRWTWPVGLAGGSLAFAAATVGLQRVTLPLGALFVAVIAVLALTIRLMPRRSAPAASAPAPGWDLPARMVVATALVLLLTGLAPSLGPRLSGLLTTFPVYAGILTVFAHHLRGAAGALAVLRGLMYGLFAFAAFFFVLAGLLERAGVGASFAAAVLTALVLQGASLWALSRRGARY